MSQILINTLKGSYPVIIENGSRRTLADKITKMLHNPQLAIVSDETVSTLYKASIDELFKKEELSTHWIIVPPGEHSKSFKKMENVIGKLMDLDFERDDIVLALGGGVIGDLTGFTASIFHRGIKWFFVPTTLLAQADASIGGKVGIHFRGIKNMVGAFHPPSMVLIDPEFLLTLTTRDFLSGLAEIFKMSLIPDGVNLSIWNPDTRKAIYTRDTVVLASVIEDFARLKAAIVESDEFDRAGRIVLNLGHTIGHALESIGSFEKFTHGEAVCVGVLFMCELSNSRGDMSDNELSKVREIFEPKASEIPSIEIQFRDLMSAINKDKKWKEGSLAWVYPLGIGKLVVKMFSENELEQTWEKFSKNFKRRFGHVK